MVGLQAGEHVWTAAFGFLITAVGLPVLTVVALAKVGGGVDSLSTPIGKVAGVLLATVCYLAVGPLFATNTKKDVCAPVGLAYLDQVVAARLPVPFVAIGGIKRGNIAEVTRRGARCCCLVSELVGAPDIPARVAEVRRAMRT